MTRDEAVAHLRDKYSSVPEQVEDYINDSDDNNETWYEDFNTTVELDTDFKEYHDVADDITDYFDEPDYDYEYDDLGD